MAAALQKKGSPIEGTGNTIAWASKDAHSKLTPYKFDRRAPGDDDVVIQISYVGICHTDLHQMHNDWGNSLYPMVPGYVVLLSNSPGPLSGVGCFGRMLQPICYSVRQIDCVPLDLMELGAD